jgi:hypothetical protein
MPIIQLADQHPQLVRELGGGVFRIIRAELIPHELPTEILQGDGVIQIGAHALDERLLGCHDVLRRLS